MDENNPLLFSIKVLGDEDPEEIDELTRQLADELDELDALSTEFAQSSELPPGAMGLSVDIGTLLLTLVEAGGVTTLFTVLGSWLSRDKRRKIEIQIGDNKLVLTDISKDEQTEFIKWFQTQSGLRLDT